MRLPTFVLLLCCACVLAAVDKPTPEEAAAIAHVDYQSKHIERKHRSSNSPRKRRKFKRTEPNATEATDYEDEYNQRVRTFASAIKDTDTFLRFLKQEESKHLGNYIRRRGFNFNNRTLTTRFLQTAPPVENDVSNTPDTFGVSLKESKYIESALAESRSRSKHENTTNEETDSLKLKEPSALLSPPLFTDPELIEPTTPAPITHVLFFAPDEDEREIRVPNRGLVPPLPSIDDNYVTEASSTSLLPLPASNITESVERRAPLPVKKSTRRPKHRMPDKYLKKDDDEYDEIQLNVAETAYYKKRAPVHRPRMAKHLNYDAQQVIPGVAGRDYTVFSHPPTATQFSCAKGSHGYYADVNAGCQVFYICTGDGRGEPLLCPNGTLFNQDVLVCDWWYNVVCH